MKVILFAVVSMVAFASVWAMLPPEEYYHLQDEAAFVLVGEVTDVEEVSAGERGTDYKATVEVEESERGALASGDTIYIDYTVPAANIDGPGGMTVSEGETYRFWLNPGGEPDVYVPAAYMASAEVVNE
ncbi:MAG: hypothetical protein JSW52_09195 [Candidatus Coatesbacteria bacterium]|nr:MAG: hypothetical protein JSW52_09195 [Candidatus Coatesbacteria bacterium]